jgi:hypothetical protein
MHGSGCEARMWLAASRRTQWQTTTPVESVDMAVFTIPVTL